MFPNGILHFGIYLVTILMLIMMISYYCLTIVYHEDFFHFFKNNFLSFDFFLIKVTIILSICEMAIEIYESLPIRAQFKLPASTIKKVACVLFSFLLLLIGGLMFIDELYYTAGVASANFETTFPSFTKDNIEYIVIAKTDSDKHLTIALPSVQDSNSDTICIIQDISDTALIDKNVEGIFQK